MLATAATDLQLAKTHSSRFVLGGKDHVVGYRRVLEGRKSCGLCIVASTQRYHKDDLMPIHGHCDCGVEPIFGDADPGQVVDTSTLEGVHAAIEERFGVSDRSGRDPVDFRQVLVTHEHGELGPVLAVKGQQFTGAESDICKGPRHGAINDPTREGTAMETNSGSSAVKLTADWLAHGWPLADLASFRMEDGDGGDGGGGGEGGGGDRWRWR
jgi:hypothetical protein